jgi:acyl-CoA dehydrogenase
VSVTAEQAMVAELVADVFGADERAAAGRSGGPGEGEALWNQLEELGLTLAAVPEDRGGGGGSLADLMTILLAAGRHAPAVALLETALAGWLLVEAGLPVEPGPMAVAPASPGDRIEASERSGRTVLDGVSRGTPGLAGAARVVVAARDQAGRPVVAVVGPESMEAVAVANVAGGGRENLRLRGVPASAAAVADRADPDQLQRRAALGRCQMIVGGLGAVRDLSVAYASERMQFGRPLLRFQAVAHQLAILAREHALAEAATRAAAEVLLAEGELPLIETAAAKVVCAKAATTISRLAHQLHGAIGITDEHPLPRLTSRLLAWRDDFGGERAWSTALGRELAAGDPWDRLSATGRFRPTPRGAVAE